MKKALANQCKPSPLLKNVTLIGGAKAGNFSDLGYAVDMGDCIDRLVSKCYQYLLLKIKRIILSTM